MKKTLMALALTLVAGSMLACGGETTNTNNMNANKPPAPANTTMPAANTNSGSTMPAANTNGGSTMNSNSMNKNEMKKEEGKKEEPKKEEGKKP